MKELGALLGEAVRRINADFELRDLLGDFLSATLSSTDASRAVAAVWSASAPDPVAVGEKGILAPLTPEEELETLRPLLDMATRTGRIVWTEDASKDDRFRDAAHRSGLHIRRLGAVPIFSGGRPIGAIAYYGGTPGPLTRPGAELLAEIAHCTAMAIEVSRLRENRTVDEITGLMSYRSLLSRLNDEIQRSATHGRTFSIVRIDPDRAETDPDRLGTFASEIRRALRPGDLVARTDSSDDFLAVLPETDRSTAVAAAEKLRSAVAASPLGISVSLGVANMPEDAVNMETLLLTVDEALSRARVEGNAVHDAGGRAQAGAAPVAERVLATREGQALEGMLRSVFSRDLALQIQLDLAASLVTGSVQGEQGLLAVLDPGGEWMLSSKVGMNEETVEDARDMIHQAAQRHQVLRDGEQAIAIPILRNDKAIGVAYLRHPRLGDHEVQLLRALCERLSAELANSVQMQKRRDEIRARQESLERAVEDLRRKYDFSAIVGSGPALTQVLQIVARAAETEAPVLVTGESGTGKELVARAVHANSVRKRGPFIVLNCAAVPPSLIESELFGHTKGAFTSAVEERKGLFESANRGTVFLDEIAEIPSEVQAKLLRAIQFGEIQRVGSDERVRANVRVVAATNRDLGEEVRRKRFREDLYYRINVFRVHVPPLREHPEDIPALIEHFCVRFASGFKRGTIRPDPGVTEILRQYAYPGNVRELENILLRAIAMSTGEVLTVKDLPPEIRGESSLPIQYVVPRTGDELEALKKRTTKDAVDRLERAFVQHALRQTGGNISEAARQTGIDRSWLQKLISKQGIDPEEFKR